ncbi:MAG: GyrI-like domain-containing protein [Phycisphaeraceae bacterium]|nr:GyrI-like domain-containing protein [Phycisphaeraceae bacterium]
MKGTCAPSNTKNTGAESIPAAAGAGALEHKHIHLTRYAYWKHIGPYHLIPNTCAAMTRSLEAQGIRQTSPMLEVYGHWTSDESKLETETFVAIS